MGKLTDLLNEGKHPVWLEATRYAEDLLANGAAPWLNVTELVAWMQKAQGLLKSDVLPVRLEPILIAWMENDDQLRGEMGLKAKSTWPLKIVLACEKLKAHVGEVLNGIGGARGSSVLALALPSPAALVDLANRAIGRQVSISDDDTDIASLYVADFLRGFGEARIEAVLIDAEEDGSRGALSLYAPIVNVAHHFRWDIGVGLGQSADSELADLGFDFSVAERVTAASYSGIRVELGAADDSDISGEGDFRYCVIPANAIPETVLEALSRMRRMK